MTRSGTNFQMARSTLATGASEEQEIMDKDIQPGNLFNVGAFFVLFREALEATIILGVLLRYLNESIDDPILKRRLRKQVWIGTSLGLGTSLLIGVLFTVMFYVLKKDVFGASEPLFAGVLLIIAVILLTWLAFKMLDISTMYERWKAKVELSASGKRTGYAFMFLAFSILVREGIESVIFIAGVGQGNPTAMVIPGILGIIIGIFVGYLLYKGSGKIPLKTFFIISTAMLLIIAAGLASNAAKELEEYYYVNVVNWNVEGAVEDASSTDNSPGETYGFVDIPESTPVLWDLSDCCDEERNYFFQILFVLVGWKSRPTYATTITYFVYWLIVCAFYIFLRMRRKHKEDKLEKEQTNNVGVI